MWLRAAYYTKKAFETLTYSAEELSRFQDRRVRHVMDAGQDMAFYQEHWGGGFHTATPETLPPIPGRLFRDQSGNMKTVLQEGTDVVRQTSGTGGKPATVTFTEQAHDWISAVYARTLYLHGYRPRKRIAQYWDAEEKRTWLGKRMIPKQYIDPALSLDQQIRRLTSSGPAVLKYFPQTLIALCKRLRSLDAASRINPSLLLTYGELLTPGMRTYIADTFEAPVYDQYAASEFGTVAWECPDGGYHIAEDMVRADICDGEGNSVSPGDAGRLVLTGLVNTATPLVRYAIGDIVEPVETQCSCETAFKRIKRIRGREKDMIKNAEGDPVFPDELIDRIAPVEDILFYRFIAEDDRYRLQYVPNKDFDQRSAAAVADQLRSRLGLEPLELEEVETVPQSSGGKLSVLENRQKSGVDDADVFG